MEQSPSPILDYAKARRRWYRLSRRQWLLVILAGMLASSVYVYGPSLYRKARFQRYQHLCLTYQLPHDTIVYSDDPTLVPGLRRRPEYRQVFSSDDVQRSPPPAATIVVGTFDRLRFIGGSAFLHERRSPDGNRWLVTVDCAAGEWMTTVRPLASLRQESPMPLPGADWHRVLQWGAPGGAYEGQGNYLTVFAAQPDATDESRFTIDILVKGPSHYC